MRAKLITPPAQPLLTLSEAKQHLRVDIDCDDSWIESAVMAATQHAEEFTGRQFITATWQQSFDGFPDVINLIRPPIQTVDFIQYYDTNGDLQTLDPSRYIVDDTGMTTSRITPAPGDAWPATQDRIASVRVQSKRGYGDDPSDVPPQVIQAVRMSLGHFYENRESVVTGTIATELPMSTQSLLWPFKVIYT